MVQANQFCGKAHEDAILLRLFPFLLLGEAKQWFYANREKHTIWNI
jgi:hypothetical protein